MVYEPHIRMSAIGRLGAGPGVERFQYSLNLARGQNGSGGVPGLQPNQTAWNDFAEDLRAFHGSAALSLHPLAVLEEVKFARIGADGKYTEDPVIVNVADTPGGGPTDVTVTQMVLPQSALAVSLTTPRRGPSGKGRFYLPMPVIGLTTNLQVQDVQRDQIQARVAQLIGDLGNQPGFDVLDLQVVVASTKGYNTSVTGVRVGRVLDTIRSRRRSIDEAYDPVTPVNQGE